jgi:phage baseplate assembly protein gpV
MIQQGQASERDVKSATARVAMDDLGGLVSGKMQVLFPAAGGWNFFWTPKEGDHVVISRLPNGQEEGYVLGKVYTGNKMPQGGESNIILLVSDNGKNVIKFDADKGVLDLICDQDCSMKMKNLNIEVTEHISVRAKTASVETEESATVKSNEILVEGVDAVTVKAPKVEVDGAQEVTVKAPKVVVDGTDTTITGGSLTTNGTAAPTGSGPYCGLPKCLFTGIDHVGNVVSNT